MEKMERKINNTETDKAITIPYFAHEGEMFRLEQIIKKLWITVILLILLLVGTNGAWIWYESQFEDVVLTQEATTDRGGYSRGGDTMSNLQAMMQDAQTDQERDAIRRVMEMM